MACVGVEWSGKRARKNGRYVTGDLERKWDRVQKRTMYFIDGVEVHPETVGQIAHKRFKYSFARLTRN